MTTRHVHLVGSMPYENEEEAMSIALDRLGDLLLTLPDGEIGRKSESSPRGERSDWAAGAGFRAMHSAAFEVVAERKGYQPGMPLDPSLENPYAISPNLKVRPRYSPKNTATHLDFGYLEWFSDSYPIFKKLREKSGKKELVFQVGVPTGLMLAVNALGMPRGLRFIGAFNQRMAYEVNEIVKVAGDDVVIQVEVPIEMGMYNQMPGFLKGLPVNGIIGLIKQFDPAARIGIHECLGDFNNVALTRLDVTGLLVPFTNRLVASWPATHKLEYVHLPLAEGKNPPPTDADLYRKLSGIRLPQGTRLIAGFVHEKLDADGHRAILNVVEEAVGHPVDIACSCGMGRRQRDAADTLIGLSAQVAAM